MYQPHAPPPFFLGGGLNLWNLEVFKKRSCVKCPATRLSVNLFFNLIVCFKQMSVETWFVLYRSLQGPRFCKSFCSEWGLIKVCPNEYKTFVLFRVSSGVTPSALTARLAVVASSQKGAEFNLFVYFEA